MATKKISSSTANKSYNKKTVAKIAARDAARGNSSQDKLSELESVTTQAKGLGIDTRKAESMIAQTKAEGSNPFKGSSFESAYLKDVQVSPFNAEVMYGEPKVNLPQVQPTPDYGSTTNADNMALGASLQGMGTTYDSSTGQFVTQPPQQPDNYQSILDQVQSLRAQNFEDLGTGEERRARLEKEAGLRQKEQAVNEYTTQLNSIIAKRDSDVLRIEGQGRGIPEVIIGGQQAQINKEAAIAALPVQAALASAQGALELAQSHVDKIYQIQSQDALAKYQYNSQLIDTVYSFANAQEQRRLDAIKVQEDRKYSEQQDFLKTQRDLLSSATQQQAPASVIAAITNAKTPGDAIRAAGKYNGDVLARQIQEENLKQLQAKPTTTASTEAPTVKTINGVDMQWNPSTGQWENIGGGQTGAQSAENLDQKYTSLLADIADARSLSNSVGAGMIERTWKSLWSSNPDYAQVQNIADTIKSNLLTLNTDPNIKKFFGPQMSNRDTELMTAAGSSLNPEKQTPEQFLRDLNDAANLIARSREAVRQGMGSGVQTLAPDGPMSTLPMNILVTPDGMEVQIID